MIGARSTRLLWGLNVLSTRLNSSAFVLARLITRSASDTAFVVGLVSATTALAQVFVAALSGVVVQSAGSVTCLFTGVGALVLALDGVLLAAAGSKLKALPAQQ